MGSSLLFPVHPGIVVLQGSLMRINSRTSFLQEHNHSPAPIIEVALVFVLSFVFLTCVFIEVLPDTPRRDQVNFLSHIALFGGDFDFLIKSLSFNRTRITGQGDFYLFRPFHMFALSLQALYLEQMPLLRGVIGNLMVASSGAALYMLSRKFLVRIYSFLLLAMFFTQVPSVEMIIWRHITPYILALTFTFVALTITLRANQNNDKYAIACFFVAMGFHDVFSYIAIVFAASCAVMFYVYKELYYKRVFRAVSIASAAFILINIFNYLYYRPRGGILGPGDILPSFNDIDILKIFGEIAQVVSASLRASFWGFNENFSLGATGILRWDFSGSLFLAVFFSFIGFVLVGWAFYVNAQNNPKRLVLVAYSACAIAVIISTLYLGRGMLRGMGYVHEASYYFYLTTPFWLLLVVLVISRFDIGNRAIKIFFVSTILLLCGFRLLNVNRAIATTVAVNIPFKDSGLEYLSGKCVNTGSVIDEAAAHRLFDGLETNFLEFSKCDAVELRFTTTLKFLKNTKAYIYKIGPHGLDSTGRSPKEWYIQGSNDGHDWGDVDHQSIGFDYHNGQVLIFPIRFVEQYKFIRIIFKTPASSSIMRIADFSFSQ
jgi:hypothetical protein